MVGQGNWKFPFPITYSELDVATAGVASVTGFFSLATNFSRLVASLASKIYISIWIGLFLPMYFKSSAFKICKYFYATFTRSDFSAHLHS